jgi:hypothetical protein
MLLNLILQSFYLSISRLLGGEITHMKEREHDKAFYKLCRHMEPDYAQLEFDLRVYLTYLEAGGVRLWGGVETAEQSQ